jgi:hypothetical protein
VAYFLEEAPPLFFYPLRLVIKDAQPALERALAGNFKVFTQLKNLFYYVLTKNTMYYLYFFNKIAY